MDKFLLSTTALKKLGINGIDTMFDENTQVSQYDFVVGQCPCSAIENMVINSAKENKPYFIELCKCNLDSIAARDGAYRNWQELLPEYDSQIKFVGDYAFNLDCSENQVKNLLYETQKNLIQQIPHLLVPTIEDFEKQNIISVEDPQQTWIPSPEELEQ